jgi:hypothetical protein
MDFGERWRQSPLADSGQLADASTDGGVGESRPTERLAIWSLLCSIVGFVVGLAAVAGIVLGFKARARIIRAEGAIKGERLALAGIITGFGALIFLVTVVLVAVLVSRSTGQSADAALAQRQLVPASLYPSGFVGQGPATKVTEASYFSGWGGTPPSAGQMPWHD